MDLAFLKCVVLAVVFVAVSTGTHGFDIKRNDDVSVSSLQALVQQQAALIQTLQTRLTATERKVNSLESSYHTISVIQQRHSKEVAFTVRFAHDDSTSGLPLTAHSTLVFDKVVSNIGNGYNTRTGIFTAPVAGVFAFFLTQMSVGSHPSVQLDIVKEGSALDVVYAQGSDQHDQGSSQVTTHLAAGQQVWVRQRYGDSIRGGWYTVFTGYLFQAD